jgi:tight adherence protein B
MEFVLAALTFAIVILILLQAFALASRGRANVVGRRLEAIERGVRRGHGSPRLTLLRDEVLSGVPTLNRLLLHWSWAQRLRDFIAQAGLTILPGMLILWSGVLGLGVYLLVLYVYSNTILALLLGVTGAAAPTAYVAFKRSRRLRAFEKSFPEAVDLLGRAVRAGHAFTTGLEMVATEMPEPVAGEFKIAWDEQNFGLSLRDALMNLAQRVPIIDVRFFVTALLIHKETGGNLAEILDNLSSVIRDRFKLLGEVRIRTAQGRLTAGILIALPPSMILIMRWLNPDYVNLLFTDPLGPYLLGGAVLLQIVGSAMLWKIVSIRV